jgi:hypothetical protein
MSDELELEKGEDLTDSEERNRPQSPQYSAKVL